MGHCEEVTAQDRWDVIARKSRRANASIGEKTEAVGAAVETQSQLAIERDRAVPAVRTEVGPP